MLNLQTRGLRPGAMILNNILGQSDPSQMGGGGIVATPQQQAESARMEAILSEGQAGGGMPMARSADGATMREHTPVDMRDSGGSDYGAMLAQTLGPRPTMGTVQKIASVLGPALMAASGNSAGAQQAIAGINAPQRAWDQRQQDAAIQDIRWRREDDLAQAERNEPQFFSGNEDRVRFDPATGATDRVYDAPQDFEDYAMTQGLEQGTNGYSEAVQDYVLRGNGPTAFQYDRDLETVRNAGRLSQEAARQANRVGLIDYRNANPAPARPRAASTSRPRAAGSQSSSGNTVRRGERTATGANGETLVVRGGRWVAAR